MISYPPYHIISKKLIEKNLGFAEGDIQWPIKVRYMICVSWEGCEGYQDH